MAKRIINALTPDAHDVVPFYALNTANDKYTDSGNGDNGVFVKVSAAGGDLNKDAISAITEANIIGFGESAPYIGRDRLFTNPLTVEAATSGNAVLGITLEETAVKDENGEFLHRNRNKADTQGVVPSGYSVPIAQHGIFEINNTAYDGTLTPGAGFKISANAGKITGCARDDSDRIGSVLGTGNRVALSNTDRYAGAAGATGTYARIQF